MEIKDAYRNTRRNTSIFCGIGVAWAAAQFDLKSLNIGIAGTVDISKAFIPAILTCLIIYSIVRCTLEYMMQPNEIRRWSLAQTDYKITLNLVRISLLVIAAASASRSIETVVGVVVATAALFLSYFVLVMLLMIIIMPLRMYIRSRQGRVSVASSAIESTYWSVLIIAALYLLIFIILCFPITKQWPLFNSFPIVQNQISKILFFIIAIIIAISFFCENKMLKKIFAFEPKEIVVKTELPNGNIGITFMDNPNHPDFRTTISTPETQDK